MLTPSSQLIGPRSTSLKNLFISLFVHTDDSGESAIMVKSSVATANIVNLSFST